MITYLVALLCFKLLWITQCSVYYITFITVWNRILSITFDQDNFEVIHLTYVAIIEEHPNVF